MDKQGLKKNIEAFDKKLAKISRLIKKTGYNTIIIETPFAAGYLTKATETEKMLANITNLAAKADLNTKAREFGSKIPDNTGFVNANVPLNVID